MACPSVHVSATSITTTVQAQRSMSVAYTVGTTTALMALHDSSAAVWTGPWAMAWKARLDWPMARLDWPMGHSMAGSAGLAYGLHMPMGYISYT